MSMRHSFLLAFAVLFAFSCNETADLGDGGTRDDFVIPVTCENGVDPSTDVDSAVALTEGQVYEDYLCPRNDKDFYKVVLAPDKSLLHIELRHRAAVTAVDLTYRILKRENGQDVAVTSAPEVDGNQIDAYHFLAPGTYYILVEDQGNDDADGKNTYEITFSSEADKDTNESNNTEAEAKALTGTTTGYISFKDDKDYFKVDAGANDLLRVRLTNENTTPVDLEYRILKPGGEEIAHYGIDDGTRVKAVLERVHHLPGAGTYYVVVTDTKGDESDLNVPYTLEITKVPEPDTNDHGGRNDHPTTAFLLGSFAGTETCANPKTFSVTGYLASHADVDYFQVDAPATFTTEPVIEIDLKFNGAANADLSVSLVLPKTDTTCTKDTCCRVLGEEDCDSVSFWGEDGGTHAISCIGTSFSCIDRGTGFCAECVDNPSASCAAQRGCAGSVSCLPAGHCGYQQFTRSKFEGAPVKTAQPVRGGGPFFLRVSDLASDEYETGVSYTMTVKLCANPDGAREPDNLYFPRLLHYPDRDPEVDGQEYSPNTVLSYLWQSQREEKAIALTIPTGGSWSPWITGTIGYEHDEDHYTFANPCPDAGSVVATSNVCLIEAEFQETGTGCPGAKGGSGLEFHYVLNHGQDMTDFPPVGSSNNGTYGYSASNNKCAMLVRGGGDFKLKVFDIFSNNWSNTCQYQVRFRVGFQGKCPIPPCQASTHDTPLCYGS
ncbi:MAG: hypothetical protein JRH20_07535 [Deltaproteobacteria bacterium]|nr:hypothetical protein [Deltaproteobacteria bacterium]